MLLLYKLVDLGSLKSAQRSLADSINLNLVLRMQEPPVLFWRSHLKVFLNGLEQLVLGLDVIYKLECEGRNRKIEGSELAHLGILLLLVCCHLVQSSWPHHIFSGL